MSRRRFLLAFAALNASLLSGCGFQLRGSQQAGAAVNLPFDSLYVGAAADSTMGIILRRELGYVVSITEMPNEAAARLEILRNQFGREIVSLSGAGRVREYQISQTVLYRVLDQNGDELIPLTRLRVQREYSFDDREVIALEREEALLTVNMEEDVANQIVRRLGALSR